MSTLGSVPDSPVAPRDDNAVGPLTLAIEVSPDYDKTKKQKGEVGVITLGDLTFLSFATEEDAKAFKP